jgi:hypothetical protein
LVKAAAVSQPEKSASAAQHPSTLHLSAWAKHLQRALAAAMLAMAPLLSVNLAVFREQMEQTSAKASQLAKLT